MAFAKKPMSARRGRVCWRFNPSNYQGLPAPSTINVEEEGTEPRKGEETHSNNGRGPGQSLFEDVTVRWLSREGSHLLAAEAQMPPPIAVADDGC